MRLRVSALISAEVGAQSSVTIDQGHCQLGPDLGVDFVRGRLALIRTDQHILVQGSLTSALSAECVRCLESFRLPVQVQLEELYALTSGPHAPDPLYVVAPDGTIDLTHPLRENVLLAQPMKPVCRPDCKGLCASCGKNLNEGPCDCEDELIDPRLAALKALL